MTLAKAPVRRLSPLADNLRVLSKTVSEGPVPLSTQLNLPRDMNLTSNVIARAGKQAGEGDAFHPPSPELARQLKETAKGLADLREVVKERGPRLGAASVYPVEVKERLNQLADELDAAERAAQLQDDPLRFETNPHEAADKAVPASALEQAKERFALRRALAVDPREFQALAIENAPRLTRAMLGGSMTVEGGDVLPQGPFILAPNHTNSADIGVWVPNALGVAAKEKGLELPGMRFLMAAGPMKLTKWMEPLLGTLPVASGAIPVRKMGQGAPSLAVGGHALDHGEILGIFPEGMHFSADHLGPHQDGAALMSLQHQVPVVVLAFGGIKAGVRQRGVGPTAVFKVVYPEPVPVGGHNVAVQRDRIEQAHREAYARAAELFEEKKRFAPPGPWWTA